MSTITKTTKPKKKTKKQIKLEKQKKMDEALQLITNDEVLTENIIDKVVEEVQKKVAEIENK